MSNQAQYQSDVARLHASLSRTYAAIATDEARATFLEGIATQIQGTTPDALHVWLTTAPQALARASRKPKLHPIALTRRERKRHAR
ncbi:MAG: hypothetical protein ACXWP0_11005 [Ktedonobacterales bacterium]